MAPIDYFSLFDVVPWQWDVEADGPVEKSMSLKNQGQLSTHAEDILDGISPEYKASLAKSGLRHGFFDRC